MKLMRNNHKHKTNIKFLPLFGVFSILLSLFLTAPVNAAGVVPQNSEMNYSYIQHDLSAINIKDVINIECIMEANQTKRRLDTLNNPEGIDEFELLTLVNFYRKDSPNVFVYSPNYYTNDTVSSTETFAERVEKGIPKEAFVVRSLGEAIPAEYERLTPNCYRLFDYIGNKINNGTSLNGNSDWTAAGIGCSDTYLPGIIDTNQNNTSVSSSTSGCSLLRNGFQAVNDVVKVDYNNFYFSRDGNGGTTIDFIFYVQDINGGSPASKNAPVISDICLLVSDNGTQNSQTCSPANTVYVTVRENITEPQTDDGQAFRYHYGLYTSQDITRKYVSVAFTICPSIVGLNTSSPGCETVSKNGKGSTFIGNTTTVQYANALFATLTDTTECYNATGGDGAFSCEFIVKADSFVESAFDKVEDWFKNDVEGIINGASDAHAQFRSLANIILSIFFMVCIISQVSGLNLSTYGIKALMPKLIIVGLLINISFELCKIIIDLTTIAAEFIKSQLIGMTNGAGTAQTISSLLGIGTGAGAIAVLVGIFDKSTIIPMILAILGLAISLLFLLAILSIRKALIAVLVIVSPVAFACYALPGTKSIFNKWMAYFKNAIMIYPVSIALLYGGVAVSSMIMPTNQSSSGDFFQALSATFAAVAPIFMIPKAVSSSVGAISSAVNKAQGKLTGMAKGGAGSVLSRSGIQRAADRQKQRRKDSFDLKKERRQNAIDQKRIDRAGKYNESRFGQTIGQTAIGKRLFSNHYNDMAGVAAARSAAYKSGQQQKAAALGAGSSANDDARAIQAAGGVKTKDGFNALMGRSRDIMASGDSEKLGELEAAVFGKEGEGLKAMDRANAEQYFSEMKSGFKGVDPSRELWATANLANIQNGKDLMTYEEFMNPTDPANGGFAKKVSEKYGKNGLANQTYKSLEEQQKALDGDVGKLAQCYGTDAIATAVASTNGMDSRTQGIIDEIYSSRSTDQVAVNDSFSAESFTNMSYKMIDRAWSAEQALGGHNIQNIAATIMNDPNKRILNRLDAKQRASVEKIYAASQPAAESTNPAPTPSESNNPAPTPSESNNPAPTPSESTNPQPSESTNPTPSESDQPAPAPTAQPTMEPIAVPHQSAMPTISGEEAAKLRPPVVSDFQYEENGQTKYNEDAIYSSPQFREFLVNNADQAGDRDTTAMMLQMANAKTPEQMRRVVNGFDLQFQQLGRTDGRGATDLRNDVFNNFIGQVGVAEQARAQSAPAPAPAPTQTWEDNSLSPEEAAVIRIQHERAEHNLPSAKQQRRDERYAREMAETTGQPVESFMPKAPTMQDLPAHNSQEYIDLRNANAQANAAPTKYREAQVAQSRRQQQIDDNIALDAARAEAHAREIEQRRNPKPPEDTPEMPSL